MSDVAPTAPAVAQVAAPTEVSKAQDPSPVPEAKPDESAKPELSAEDKLKQAYEKRIARQTAANREQQRQFENERRLREAAEKRIAEYEGKTLNQKPEPDNFSTPEEYAEALADFKFKEREKNKAEEAAKPTPEQIANNAREFERKAMTFKAKEAEFMKADPQRYEKAATVVNTFTGLMDRTSPSFKEFERVVFESDKAPAIIQYLGENPIEIAKLAALSPVEVKYGLEDIIENLSVPAPQDGPEGEDETPEALPAPISPITKSAAKPKKTVDQMNGKELLAHMEKLQRRGR